MRGEHCRQQPPPCSLASQRRLHGLGFCLWRWFHICLRAGFTFVLGAKLATSLSLALSVTPRTLAQQEVLLSNPVQWYSLSSHHHCRRLCQKTGAGQGGDRHPHCGLPRRHRAAPISTFSQKEIPSVLSAQDARHIQCLLGVMMGTQSNSA